MAAPDGEATYDPQLPDEEEYVVEKLLAFHKDETEEGLEWFRVKWAGYTEPTWTLRGNIPEELTSRLFRKRKKTRRS